MSRPDVVSTVADLRARTSQWRLEGARIALVPTMGALHDGHLALVEAARGACDRVVTSIFVNPSQFAPHEDLAAYPRDLEQDLRTLTGKGVDLVYAPDVAQMYPQGASTAVTVGGPSEGLESLTRPHFFAGVATVVAKLLIQCAPDVAAFGEKDFQQLAVVRRMARDLSLATEIIAVPTVREADGLAMSSRNVYLQPAERARAPVLSAALQAAAAAIGSGAHVPDAIENARRSIEAAGFVIDYVELRDSGTLASVMDFGRRPARLLAAASLAGVRLIDNVPVTKTF